MKPLLVLAAAVPLVVLASGFDPFGARERPAPRATTATIRGVCRYVGTAKPAMLDPMPGMGCASPHLDGTLDEGLDHALGDCVVSLDLPWEEPTEATATPSPPPVRFRLEIDPCEYRPRMAAARAPVQVEVRGHPDRYANLHVYRESLADTVSNFLVSPGALIEDAATLFLARPGRYLFRCDMGASYAATLCVFHHAWFDVTRSAEREGVPAGGFRLADVPPGDHDVRCVHEGVVRTPVRVDGRTVSYASAAPVRLVRRVHVAAGETVTVDFDVPEDGATASSR